MPDPYDLQRFVDAQEPVFNQVLDELRSGSKESHWIWFVFPQLRGLGHSWMATKYGISGFSEAEAYLQHGILGPRLIECTTLVVEQSGRTADQIFGFPDDLKFRSSMTLFGRVAPDDPLFQKALANLFSGRSDPLTLDLLSRSS